MATREELQAIMNSAASNEETSSTPEQLAPIDVSDSPFDLTSPAPAGGAAPSLTPLGEKEPAVTLQPTDLNDPRFDLSSSPAAGAAPGSGKAVPVHFLPSEGDLDVGVEAPMPPDFAPALMQGALQSLKSLGTGAALAGEQPEALTGLGLEDFLQRKVGKALEDFAGGQLKNHPELVRPERLRGGVVEMLSDPTTRMDYIQRILGENIPNVLGSLATAATGFKLGGPIAGLLGSQQFSKALETGGANEELVEMGVAPQDARKTAEAVGLVNSLLDVAPIGKIMNDIPGLKQAWNSHVTKEMLDPIKRSVVTQVITTGLLESATEGTQEVILNLGKQFYDENQSLLEGVDEAAFAGLMLGGGAHATVAAVDAVLPSETERIPTIPEETTEASRAAAEQIMELEETPRAEGEQVLPENSRIGDTEAIQLDEAEAQWDIQERQRSALAQFKLNMKRADVAIEPAVLDDLSGTLDSHNVALDQWTTFNQIIKRHGHIQGLNTPQLDGSPGLQQLYELMMGVTHDGELQAEQRAKELNHLDPKQARAWGEVMLERSLQSANLGRKLSVLEEQTIMRAVGLKEQGLEMMERIDQDFASNLDKLYDTMFSRLLKQYPEGGVVYDEQVDKLNTDMESLRNRNFFPFSRFGKFLVTVYADKGTEHEGKQIRKGSKILEEAYATEGEAKEAAEFWKKQNVGKANTVALDKRTDNDLNFAGLPSIMLGQIQEKLGLDQDQADALAKIKEEFSPGQGFRKRMLKRKGVAGFSQDAQKAYMSYQMQFNRFLAKLQYTEEIDSAIDQVEASAHQIAKEGGNAINRREIVRWLRQHREYVMNPGPEWAMWRSVSFMWYLAAIPEKVFLNLMQLPTMVYPFLAARYGEPKTVRAMAKASTLVWNMWRHPERMDPFLAEALRESQRQGHTDQSFAVEAAAMAESRNLARFAPSGVTGGALKTWAKLSEVGTYLFAKSELVNRRTAFIAGWLLEMEKSGNVNRAWVAAKMSTREGTFVFAKYNRPKFMRGRKSSLFVFWQHWQQYMNAAFQNDPAAWRALVMLVAIAGLNGLPGAESLQELLKFLARQVNKQAGKEVLPEDPSKWAKEQYKEMIEVMVDDPDGVLAAVTTGGASKYGFGLPWLGEQIGVPIPATDMSASLSLGRIPMLNDFLSGLNTTGGFSQALERTVTGVGGAGYGIPLAMAKAASRPDSDPMNTMITVAPRWAAYPAKAYQRFANGGSQYRGGGTVPGSEIDPQNPWQLAEVIAQAMGFPSTRENLAKERDWNKREAVLYWNTRRQMILIQLWEVYKKGEGDLQGKREVLADLKKAQKTFNASVPFKSLRISPADIQRSIYGKKRAVHLKELGLPSSLKAREIYEDEEGTVISEEAIPGSSKR